MSQETEILQRQLDSLIAELAEVRREAEEDGIDEEEQAMLDEIQAMIDTTRSALSEAQRHDYGTDPEAEVQQVAFEEGLEINVPDPRVAGRVRFDDKRSDFVQYLSEWRNNCKIDIESLVSSMLERDEEGPDVPRGDLISLASTVLDIAGADPRIGVAIGTLNTLFDLAKNAYERTLPRQPSIRQAQVAWCDALDAITEQQIQRGYPQIEAGFKRANGIPAGDEWVLPSFQADWNYLIDQCREGAALPSSRSIRRQFMTTIIRAMPDSPWDDDLSSGTVTISLSYDADRQRFGLEGGYIDDVTDEVAKGLRDNPGIYGPNVTDLPLPIEFRIHSSALSDFGNSLICSIWRRTRRSGDTSFRLDQRPGGPMTLEEQEEVFQHFTRSRPYMIETRRIL